MARGRGGGSQQQSSVLSPPRRSSQQQQQHAPSAPRPRAHGGARRRLRRGSRGARRRVVLARRLAAAGQRQPALVGVPRRRSDGTAAERAPAAAGADDARRLLGRRLQALHGDAGRLLCGVVARGLALSRRARRRHGVALRGVHDGGQRRGARCPALPAQPTRASIRRQHGQASRLFRRLHALPARREFACPNISEVPKRLFQKHFPVFLDRSR